MDTGGYLISGIYPGIGYRWIQGDTGGYLISGIYPGIGYRGIYNLRDISRNRITLV